MPTLFVLRGLPGSGKTTYANENYPLMPLYEADMFFGVDYKWNPTFLGLAHRWCYYNVLKTLYIGNDCVVANVLGKKKDLEEYLNIKNIINGVDIEIIEMRTQYKSKHGVAKETMERMKRRWVDSPEGYKLTIVE